MLVLYIGKKCINRLAKKGLLENINNIELSTYEYCLVGKITRKLFGKGTRAKVPL